MNENEQIEQKFKLKLIEAFIFASEDPVKINLLKQFELDEKKLLILLKKLEIKYEDSGFNLINIDGSYTFRTSEEVSGLLNIEQEVSKQLSRAATETLGIIAYHQPITRSQIEEIRGVSLSKGTLDILFEIGWVKPGKRLEVPGRPATWLTTNKFLDHFGLSHISDLPGLDELKEAGLLNFDSKFFQDPKIEANHIEQ
ncbi:MAG: SMC-Scp complex subunit ScpB [SAR116 cluster bacterium]|nr:SMC-Scp complex subunit ScpB [SAR116 cluster bacterium]RPH10019.1 MAG: SMC-Scp complex subunit ScpB [Alphaproteobacteria bacterium TMED54]|tara:strand:- start:1780 stop:2373 length:594 start_codon:yes stop_codon:yes gene_type:complete